MSFIKGMAARLPSRWQYELKRYRYRKKILNNSFVSEEQEFGNLREFISPGDWVIDIGANVGHYTKRFSELVGPQGRVVAFEPVTETFSLLSANVQLFDHQNVTLMNAAVSDKLEVVGMSLPLMSTGLKNFYQAHISSASESAFSVLAMSIDSLDIGQRIALVKIDAEGHERSVIAGMVELLKKHKPVLIVETFSPEVIADLEGLGYDYEKAPNSPNIVFKP